MIRFALLLVVAGLIAAPMPAIAAPPTAAAGITVPVVGTGAGSTFNGTFTLNRFATNAAGQLVGAGTLAGTLTNTATNEVTSILQSLALPVKANYAGTVLPVSADTWKSTWEFTRNVYPVAADKFAWTIREELDAYPAVLRDWHRATRRPPADHRRPDDAARSRGDHRGHLAGTVPLRRRRGMADLRATPYRGDG